MKAIDSGGLHAIFAAFDLEEEGQVASIDEELAAKQAQTVISTLSPFASNPDIVATLRNAKDKAARAMTSFPSERLLNEARHTIVNVLSDLIHAIEHGPLRQEKIGKAKDAIEVWKNLLEAQH